MNEETQYLSPHWSKRQCYFNFCRSLLGVAMKSDSKGNMSMTNMNQIAPQAPPAEVEEDGNNSSSSSSCSSSEPRTVEVVVLEEQELLDGEIPA
jgi:hypothetical protein